MSSLWVALHVRHRYFETLGEVFGCWPLQDRAPTEGTLVRNAPRGTCAVRQRSAASSPHPKECYSYSYSNPGVDI